MGRPSAELFRVHAWKNGKFERVFGHWLALSNQWRYQCFVLPKQLWNQSTDPRGMEGLDEWKILARKLESDAHDTPPTALQTTKLTKSSIRPR